MASVIRNIFLIAFFFISCNNTPKENQNLPVSDKKYDSKSVGTQKVNDTMAQQKKAVEYTIRIIKEHPHDPKAFTQGLVYLNGYLVESTGLRGSSSLRKVDIETGKVIKEVDVPAEYFAEGITIFKNKIYQLTWNSNICLVYDLFSFKQQQTFEYYGEGWGLTHNGGQLIMSDGSNIIRFINPLDFKLINSVAVMDDNMNPVHYLNELEYINGEIWANIWQSDKIARIDPASGHVNGWIDISGLRQFVSDSPEAEVSNGIAYDSANDKIYLTGKNWPLLFEVKVVEK